MQLTLLQYNVRSRTVEAEKAKQQLIQTALCQGLCDLAFLQRCSGIHEPIRAGTGAVFQSGCDLPSQSTALDEYHKYQSGVMLCYSADRFEERQLATSAADLPGWAYKAVQLYDKCTGNTFIVMTACMSAGLTAQCQHSAALPISPFLLLMQRFSTVYPVIAAAEVATLQGLDSGISSLHQHMQICLCTPVHHATSTSQAFFAALSTSSLHQVQLSGVQTLLPMPAASTLQYFQNAHTAVCKLEHTAIKANLRSATAVSSDSVQSPPDYTVTATMCAQHVSAHQRLQSLVAAAEQASDMSDEVDSITAVEQSDALGHSQAPGQWQAPQLIQAADTAAPQVPQAQQHDAANLTKTNLSQDAQGEQVSINVDSRSEGWVRGPNPAPLLIHQLNATQVWASEIEPKEGLTPKQANELRQLIQTNSGNLSMAGSRATRSHHHSHMSQDSSSQLSPAAPFQLQPRPIRDHGVDVNAMRIMQLQRNISQGSRSGSQTQLMAEEALATQELGDAESSSGTLRRRPASDMSQTDSQQAALSDAAANAGDADGPQEYGHGMHQSEELCTQGDGLYAAAAKVPTEMKEAWKEEMEGPQNGNQVAAGKQKGRGNDEKTILPMKLLKCLQGKTLSDVEAQMHALGVDKHLQ